MLTGIAIFITGLMFGSLAMCLVSVGTSSECDDQKTSDSFRPFSSFDDYFQARQNFNYCDPDLIDQAIQELNEAERKVFPLRLEGEMSERI